MYPSDGYNAPVFRTTGCEPAKYPTVSDIYMPRVALNRPGVHIYWAAYDALVSELQPRKDIPARPDADFAPTCYIYPAPTYI